MNKPDWKDAPLGATHWGPEVEGKWYSGWYRLQEDGWYTYFEFDEKWRKDPFAYMNKSKVENMI